MTRGTRLVPQNEQASAMCASLQSQNTDLKIDLVKLATEMETWKNKATEQAEEERKSWMDYFF